MAKQITLRCKTCDKLFSYSEEAYRLAAEKGDSRIERCENCSDSHGKEIKDTESPYFQFRKEKELPLIFTPSEAEFSFRGERIPQTEERLANQSGMDISITDKEIVTLYQKLEENQAVVMVSPTGTGKSTYVPKRLARAPEGYTGDFVERLVRQGQIIITQPRIFATLQTAETTAKISGEEIGPYDFFGSKYSGGDNSGPWNRGVSITDGTLPNWIRQGKLGQYSLIMVDEAHERSCNIDLILGFLKRELPKHPQLRVIISSATINAQKFLDSFREVNISVSLLDIPSRKKFKKYEHFWKCENVVKGCSCWLCEKTKEERRNFWRSQIDAIKEYDLPEACANFALRILNETDEGSIIVFLHGEVPIKETVKRIKSRCKRDIEIIPIYRQIQDWAEAELKRTEGKRRVIVATNIVETSVTIPDLVYGVNSGWIKQIEWDPATQTQRLKSKLHSRDGNRQRGGRLGRNQDGYVYHFFTKEEWEDDNRFEEHTSPEVTRSCLDDSLVTLKAAGLGAVEQFPWMEKPADWTDMAQEMKRAQQSLVSRGVVGQKGEIVERSLDLLGIPRSSIEASLLFLADEQGVLFETLTVLILMSSRDGEARTGANLYNPYCGLLLWDEEWIAKTKAKVSAIHQGLKVGCQDDLDFVVKLTCCFQKAENNNLAREWAEYHFVNYGNLKSLLSEIDELVTKTFGEEREESFRKPDLDSLDKVRLLMTSTWPDRITSLGPGNLVLCQINNKTGVISFQCVGNWESGEKALAMTLVEGEAVIDGYPQRVPTASFMVSLPNRTLKRDLFVDQRFPIGSWVEIKEGKGKTYLDKLGEAPSSIRISFKKSVWLSEEKKEKTVSFDQRFILNEPQVVLPQGVWFGQKQANHARIIEWTQQGGVPVAILSPFAESDISKLGKVKGDSLRVNVHRVVRDPIGKNGWASVRTPRFEIPAELSDLNLSDWGPGLEQLEGRALTLVIKDFDADGFPRLSNLEKVMEDMKAVQKEISESKEISASKNKTAVSQRPYISLSGFVAEIIEDQEKTIVVVPRENGILHPFEITQGYVPGANLKNLRVNEKVVLRLFQVDVVEIPADNFTEEEVKNRPKKWKIKKEEDKILVPSCCEDSEFEGWSARPEAIDFVKRRSWQYCLQARIVSSESLEQKKKKEQEEFVERTQDNIRRWENNIRKAREAIKRRRENIAKNRARLIRTKDFEERVKLWIMEDERKIRDIELSIRDWLNKIDDARRKLRY